MSSQEDALRHDCHLRMANHTLRAACMETPSEFYQRMCSHKYREYLQKLLNSAMADCAADRHPDFSVFDFKVHCGTIDGAPFIAVLMPEPLQKDEVYLAVAVYLIKQDCLYDRKTPVEVRYFTLRLCETPIAGGAVPDSVLTEWRNGGYLSHGKGPAFHKASFITMEDTLLVIQGLLSMELNNG